MQVGNIVTEKIHSTRKKKKADSASAFTVSDEDDVGAKTISSGAVNVNSLWQLQAFDDWSIDVDKMKERGEELIEGLNEIRFALLNGELYKEDLQSLAESIAKSQIELQFPQLQTIIDEIRLRAEVELAKMEQLSGAR